MGRGALAAIVLIAATHMTLADTKVSQGLSVFGDLKYGADFAHFDYVNPDAPKGGTLRILGIDTFETLNPFILKGQKEAWNELIFDTLMTRASDEPDAMYGLVAESVEVADNRSWVAFNINPDARFHDGSPVTADDVAFTFETLVKEGHPSFRINYADVLGVEIETARRVKFAFKAGYNRDLPIRLAELPILSKRYYESHAFNETTFEAPLSSGPYRVASVEPGRAVVYERVPDYWARDLNVSRGRHNFDAIRVDYYRDRDVALEAFLAGEYDFREEFTSRDWATKYTTDAVRDGRIVLDTLPDETPSGVQAWFFNLRRDKFKDRRVRHALDLAFDYEWTNKNLFYGLYRRTNSMFENSALAAHDPPSDAELALLEPLRGQVPPEVFKQPYKSPETDGSGNIRRNLRDATKLLGAAGWKFKDGALRDASGEAFEIEFLLFEGTFSRIVLPYVANLKRLGIQATARVVDVTNFKYRTDHFDFDVIVQRYVQPLTPGIEQRNYWGSKYADIPGSLNLAGIKDPAVDSLIESVVQALDRSALFTAVHALDRVLMWNHYSVPQWYKGSHNVAYWDKFSRPKVKPRFSRGVVATWWYDAAKASRLEAGRAPDRN